MKKTYGKGKRFLSLLLAVVMIFSQALPTAAALEAERETTSESTAETEAPAVTGETTPASTQVTEAPVATGGMPDTEESGEEPTLYAPVRAEQDGYFVLVAETSADGILTDGFAIEPVRVAYMTGDTILDAVARLEDVQISEKFGADIETGRITLNEREYVATSDTHVGLMTLTDMYRPEEVGVVRLHQSIAGESGADHFPEVLQNLLRAMAAAEDKENEAYLAAVERYGEAVNDAVLAAQLTTALGWTAQSEAVTTPSATPDATTEPATDAETKSDPASVSEDGTASSTTTPATIIAPVRIQPAVRADTDTGNAQTASVSLAPTETSEPTEAPESTETPESHAPELVYGVEQEVSEVTAVNREWTLDLTKIFVDYNDDLLTYTVAIDGGEASAIEGTAYSFTPDSVGEHTLVFTASCDKSEQSAVYTVELSVQEGVYEVRFSITYAGIDLPDATLTLRNANYELIPHTQGNYNFMLRPGKYMYAVSLEGYEEIEQVIFNVMESDEPMLINVELAPTQTVKYPVVFYLTDEDGTPVTGATITMVSLDYENKKTTSSETGEGYYSFEIPRGRYTYTVSCTEGYGLKQQGWNWVTYDYREIYEPCAGNLTVVKSANTQETELTLTAVQYPWLTGFTFQNHSSFSAREDQDAWNILQGSLYSEPITLHFDGPDYTRISTALSITNSFIFYPQGKTQPEAVTEIVYTNLSGEEKKLSFTFDGKLTDASGNTGWKPNDLANERDGSGRFTMTLTRGDEVQQYDVELLIHRTLKALTVSAGGEAALLGPAFSADTTEYDVEVPAGTTSLFITATPFLAESKGYRVTINGETVTGGQAAEIPFAGGKADVEVTVSHTADTERGLASATTYTLHVNEGVSSAYETRFAVTGGGTEIGNAHITVLDAAGNAVTASAENAYVYSLLTGNYTYEITAEGYKKENGAFTVGMAERTVNVALEPESFSGEMLLTAVTIANSTRDDGYADPVCTAIRPGVFDYSVILTDCGTPYIKAEFAEGAVVSLEYTYDGTEYVYDISNGGWAMSYVEVSNAEQDRIIRVRLGDVEQVYTFHYATLPELYGMTVSTDIGAESLSPKFDRVEENYTVLIPQDAQSVYIRATLNYTSTDDPKRSVSIDGVSLPADCHGRTVTLETDENGRQTIPVTVTYKSTGLSRTYSVTVQREERHNTPMLKSVHFAPNAYNGDGEQIDVGFRSDKYDYDVCIYGKSTWLRMGAQLSDEYADGTYRFLFTNADGSTTEQSWSRTNDTEYSLESVMGTNATSAVALTIRCTSADGETVQDYVFHFTTHAPFPGFIYDGDRYIPGAVAEETDEAFRQEDGCLLYGAMRTIPVTEEVESLTLKCSSRFQYSVLIDGEPMEDLTLEIPVEEKDRDYVFTVYSDTQAYVLPTKYVVRIAHAQTVILSALQENGNKLPTSASVTMTVVGEDGITWNPNNTRTEALQDAGSEVYELPAGIYTYTISAKNEAGTRFWQEVTGQIVVSDEAQTVTVKLAEYKRGQFPVTVNVTKDGTPVKGVKLTVNGETQELFDGTTTLSLATGRKYPYTVEAPGCATVSGTFDVLGEAVTLDVAMEPSPGAIDGDTITVYVSLMDGDTYMTDESGEIYRRPVKVSYSDLSEMYMTGYYDDYAYNPLTTMWEETGAPSGHVTVLMALLEVERQFYGSNTMKLTERSTSGTSGGEVSFFMGSARPVNLFVDHCLAAQYYNPGVPAPKIVWLRTLSDGQDLTIMVNDDEFSSESFLGFVLPGSDYTTNYLPVNETTAVVDNYTRLTIRPAAGSTQWPLTNGIGTSHVEIRRADETEWQTLEDVSESSTTGITIFFGEPGIYYLRVKDSSMSAYKSAYHWYGSVKVVEAPVTPVSVSVSATYLDEPVTEGLSVTFADANGKVTKGQAGKNTLSPGEYTYTLAYTVDGTEYTKTGRMTLSSGDPEYVISEEFLEKSLLKTIEISESGDPGTWNVIDFTGERGVFHYAGKVTPDEGRKNMYIRAALADGVTGTIEINYTIGGYTTEVTKTLKSGDTYAGEMSQFFWVGYDRKGDKDITVTVTADDGRRQVFTVELYMEPWILRAGVTSGGLMQTVSMEPGQHTFTVEVPVGADSAELVLVPYDTANSSRNLERIPIEIDGYEPEVLPGDGCLFRVPIDPEKDTSFTARISGWGRTGEYTFTLTHKDQKQGKEILEDMTILIGSTSSKKTAALYPLFQPDVHEYTMTVSDNLQYLSFKTLVSEAERKGATVEVTYLSGWGRTGSPSNGIQTTQLTDLTGETAQEIKWILRSYAAGESWINITTTDRDGGQQVYRIRVLRDRSLRNVQLYREKVNRATAANYYSYGIAKCEFDEKTLECSVDVSATLEKVYMTLETGDTEYYQITVNGETLDGTQVSDSTVFELPLDGAKTRFTFELVYDDGIVESVEKTYKLTINRSLPVKVKFNVTPADAKYNVLLRDADDAVHYPRLGTFTLGQKEEYTYSVTAVGYVAQTGSFCAEKDTEIDIELVPAQENPDINADISAEWGSFRGNDDNNGVTDAKTPTSADTAELYWATSIASGGQANGAPGTPIIVNGEIYTYSGKELIRLDSETGEVLARGEMQGSSSFAITPPAYAEGMIFVALGGGKIQAFNALTLESLWLYTDSLGIETGANQPNCPITYSNGCIYTGFWNSEEAAAHMVCLTITDEDPSQPLEAKMPLWVRTQSGGFYWAGALATDNFVLVGTEDGEKGNESQTSALLSLNPVSGALLDSIDGLNGDIRSTVSYDAATDSYYFTSSNGSFYSVKVKENGRFVSNSLKELQLGGRSVSTPVIHNGRAYIGVQGTAQFKMYDGHHIAVIDLATWTIAYTANTKGFPQTSGLLTTGYGDEVYVYFADNYTPGSLRVIRDKPGQTKLADPVSETYTSAGKRVTVDNCAPVLFTPQGDLAQYCIASPVADKDGTIYMKNDSNHIFAIGSKVESIELVQEPDKTRYDAGEKFDPTGMKVVAHLANGAEKDITNSKLLTWRDAELEGNEITVQLTYKLSNSSYTVLVPIVVVTDADHEAQRLAREAIQAIGEVTLEKESQIRKARELYDAVIPELQEELKDSLVILEAAEKKLAELIAERDAVRDAESLVDRIAEPVTLESEKVISAARAAYDALTVRQKEMYSSDHLTRLEKLEAALAEKKKQAAEEEAREEENRKKIGAVETLIDAIGTVTKNSAAAITEARTAFDALDETLQSRVGNYNVLLAAETAYKRILASGQRPTQVSGGVSGSGTIGSGGTTGTATGGTTNNGTVGTANGSGTNGSLPESESIITDTPGSTVPSGETAGNTETDVSSGQTGGRIETGVMPGESAVSGKDEKSGLVWLWWTVPLAAGIGVVFWLMLGKKHDEDEDET